MDLRDILVFDVETTGLPAKGADYKTDFNDFPRIVQLAYYLNGEYVNRIIKPEGWTIPVETTEIHGITTEYAMEVGIPFATVADEFIFASSLAKWIVAHNIYFDTSLIKANILRLGMPHFSKQIVDPVLHKDKRIDTMKSTIKFVGAKHSDGRGGKWPTLMELYFKLWNEEFPAHDAIEDVKALVRCLPELDKLGIIKFE